MVGIESIKNLLMFIFSLSNAFFTLDQNQDGKVTTIEIFTGLSSTIFMNLPQIYSTFPFVKEEFRDLTVEELDELVLFVEERFDLPMKHDELERFIKDTLLMLQYNNRYVRKTIEFFRGDKDQVQE